MPQRFIGINLAWSRRNTSGIVALECNKNKINLGAFNDSIGDDSEIIDFVRGIVPTFSKNTRGHNLSSKINRNGGCFIAIDAPLLVPNEKGTRPVDIEVAQRFRAQEAGALPANRTLLRNPEGDIRGETLTKKLENMGFIHSFKIEKQGYHLRLFEVFPHPAMVIIFNLPVTLKYKAKKGRSLDSRLQELKRYRMYLSRLQYIDPPLSQNVVHTFSLDNTNFIKSQGGLKHYEDLLDALFCAWLAAYFWFWGNRGYEVMGNMATGYIILPKS